MNTENKSAYVAIIGRPNVGKSSILNRLLNKKVAIVTKKPQTTRNRILGVLTQDEYQLVFMDTPGMHRPRNKLGEYMIKTVNTVMVQVDVVLFVIEAGTEIGKIETGLINTCKDKNLPVVLAINKVDLLKNKGMLAEQIDFISKNFNLYDIVPVSAKEGTNMNELLQELKKHTIKGGHFFPKDTVTDQPEKVIAAEIIREKILICLEKEVPHGTCVLIESFSEREHKNIIDIQAVIYCEKDTHKGIIIGKNGLMLKRIGKAARLEMESLLNAKVNMELWVKVKQNWRNKDLLLRNFGYDSNLLKD